MHAMEEFVAKKGKTLTHSYTFYATCPKCSKKLGKNQSVVFAQVE